MAGILWDHKVIRDAHLYARKREGQHQFSKDGTFYNQMAPKHRSVLYGDAIHDKHNFHEFSRILYDAVWTLLGDTRKYVSFAALFGEHAHTNAHMALAFGVGSYYRMRPKP